MSLMPRTIRSAQGWRMEMAGKVVERMGIVLAAILEVTRSRSHTILYSVKSNTVTSRHGVEQEISSETEILSFPCVIQEEDARYWHQVTFQDGRYCNADRT